MRTTEIDSEILARRACALALSEGHNVAAREIGAALEDARRGGRRATGEPCGARARARVSRMSYYLALARIGAQ